MKSFALVAIYILYGAGDFSMSKFIFSKTLYINVINMENNNSRLYNEDRKYVACTFRGVGPT
jgi:hypothetical protein